MIIDGEEVNLPKCKMCNAELTHKNSIYENGHQRLTCRECLNSPERKLSRLNDKLGSSCRVCSCEITKENIVYTGYGNVRSECRECYRLIRMGINKKTWPKYYRKMAEKIRNNKLLRKYGITADEYDEMYKNQKGLCLICCKKDEKLVVDHDHKTNKVRGLICFNCNVILGHSRDDKEILRKCIAYLDKYGVEEEFKYYHDGFVHSFI